MYKFYMKVVNENVIYMYGKAKKVPKNAIEITEEFYNEIRETVDSIPSRAGYTKKVTLYTDLTYDVEYLPVVEEAEEE